MVDTIFNNIVILIKLSRMLEKHLWDIYSSSISRPVLSTETFALWVLTQTFSIISCALTQGVKSSVWQDLLPRPWLTFGAVCFPVVGKAEDPNLKLFLFIQGVSTPQRMLFRNEPYSKFILGWTLGPGIKSTIELRVWSFSGEPHIFQYHASNCEKCLLPKSQRNTLISG